MLKDASTTNTKTMEFTKLLKSGKLVLTECKEDTGEAGLRTWTMPMLEELVGSRKRAIGRRKIGGQGGVWDRFLGRSGCRSSRRFILTTGLARRTCSGSINDGSRRKPSWETGGARTGKRFLVEED